MQSVHRRFLGLGGGVEVLRGVHLTVARGEMVALQGASGSGKTTLLLCAGTLLRADSGRIEIANRCVSRENRAELRQRYVGFVFQQFHLLPYLTLEENVSVALRDWPRAQRSSRCREVLESLGLEGRRRHRPAAVSTGERQRTALARALAPRSALVLADEPTGNLDPDSLERVFRTLREYASQGGAVLVATHSTEFASGCDRRWILRNGTVVAADETTHAR